MRLFAGVILVVAAASASAQPAGATLKPAARVHFTRGLKLYERKQYDAAVEELEAGLAVDPQPELLYSLGQAERRRGRCDRAIERYQACLALLQEPAAAAAVRLQIERCRAEQPKPPEASPAPAPATPTPPSPSTAAPEGEPPDWVEPAFLPTRAAPPSWRRDPLGASLTALGLAGLAAGGALVGVAVNQLDHAGDSYQRYADARSAPTLRTAGLVTLSVGGALVVAGVLRWALVGVRARRERAR